MQRRILIGSFVLFALLGASCTSSSTPAPTAAARSAEPSTTPTSIQQLQVGAASVVITPEGWEPFDDENGNNRFDDGEPFDDHDGDGLLTSMLIAGDAVPDGRRVINEVLDDLFVTAVVIDDGQHRVAIAGMDITTMARGFTDRVRTGLAESGSDIDDVLLVASHSHEAFEPTGFVESFSPSFEEGYWDTVVGRTVQAIVDAATQMQPAVLRVTATAASLEAGEAIQADVRAPNIVDNAITTLQFSHVNGAVIATLVHFGSHPEMLQNDDVVTSDYPGQVRRRLDAHYAGSTTVWLTGALGSQVTSEDASFSYDGVDYPDADPDPWTGGSAAKAEAVGNVIADLVINALDAPLTSRQDCGFDTVARTDILVPVENKLDLEGAEGATAADIPVALFHGDGSLMTGTIDIDDVHLLSEVGLVEFCDVAIVSTPFEVAPELWLGCYDGSCVAPNQPFMDPSNPTAEFIDFPTGPFLVDHLDVEFAMVTSLTNDGLGYAVAPSAFALHPSAPWRAIWTEHHYDEFSSLTARASAVLDDAVRELTGVPHVPVPPSVFVAAEQLDRYAGPWGSRLTLRREADLLIADVARFGTSVELIARSETSFFDPEFGLTIDFDLDESGRPIGATYWSPGEGTVTIDPGTAVAPPREVVDINVGGLALAATLPAGFELVEEGVWSNGSSYFFLVQVPAAEAAASLPPNLETMDVRRGGIDWTVADTELDDGPAALAVHTDADLTTILGVAAPGATAATARAVLETALTTIVPG